MERYTARSSWPDGHWIVPLARFADENGKLPQEGQFVPQEVIDRLAELENLMEQKYRRGLINEMDQ